MGDDCVTYLRGMFAFAVWDVAQRRLLLARDRVGKKPLIYASRNGDFSFASEIRALLEDPDLEEGTHLDAINSFLQYQYVPAPLTAFSSLKKLPSASHAYVARTGASRSGDIGSFLTPPGRPCHARRGRRGNQTPGIKGN